MELLAALFTKIYRCFWAGQLQFRILIVKFPKNCHILMMCHIMCQMINKLDYLFFSGLREGVPFPPFVYPTTLAAKEGERKYFHFLFTTEQLKDKVYNNKIEYCMQYVQLMVSTCLHCVWGIAVLYVVKKLDYVVCVT